VALTGERLEAGPSPGCGGGEGVGAGQKLRCSELAVFRLVGFGFGAGVESAELRVVGSQEHLAAAV
jgi:hypothetical protein